MYVRVWVSDNRSVCPPIKSPELFSSFFFRMDFRCGVPKSFNLRLLFVFKGTGDTDFLEVGGGLGGWSGPPTF